MTKILTLGRMAAGAALLVLASCVTIAEPGRRCRWRLLLEPRVTTSLPLDGSGRGGLHPTASLTARPVCRPTEARS